MALPWDVIYHEISVGFKLIEIAFFLLFAMIFILKLRNKYETRSQKEIYLGTTIFMLCYLVSDVFFLLAFYGNIYLETNFYFQSWKIATIIGISGTAFFIFTIEKNIGIIKRLKTHYAFTIISSVLLILTIVINVEIGRLIAYLSLPFIFLLVLLFHFYIYLKAPNEYKRDLFLSFLGFLIFLISYTLPTEIARNILSIPMEHLLIISSILIIFGIGLYTIKIPPNAELEWHESIIALLIIHSVKGMTLYEYDFKEKMGDGDLIAGGLVGISSIIQEMTKSNTDVKIIQQENRNILLEHGEYVTTSLISNEDLQILRKKLSNLTDEFERLFKEQLKDWKGNLDIFQPAKALIEQTFEIERFFT
ncbi:MAG: hypothetical protein EU548_02040 [Promethearchaeota archaeon]|nr:MAG: hypothetical protein EU548_02040 [Candidatus Lokiarchaeota archaeon]